MMLSRKCIIPPDEWMHDIDMKDSYGKSIRSNFEKYNYVYVDG